MLRIRIVEERIAAVYPEQEMRCPVHLCIGQEAVATGVCAALAPRDQVLSGHRAHGHYLAKGGNLNAMVAEFYGKVTGCCQGKGGSMHLVDLAAGFVGAVPILASTIPISVGLALADAMRGDQARVTVVFFGDGAIEEGTFHEAANYAALRRLPVLFVCENNGFSVYSPLASRQPSPEMMRVARAHDIEGRRADGNDASAVYALARQAVEKARSGGGPTFLELETYRWREHCGPLYDDDLGYRAADEAARWQDRCPVARATRELLAEGLLTAEGLTALRGELELEAQEAIRFARASAFPPPDAVATHVHPPPRAGGPAAIPPLPVEAPGRSLTFAHALKEAVGQSMARDPGVFIMGLGVPDPKGLFGSTQGLRQEFGAARVLDMPASENGMTGVAIGAAIAGLRPIIAHQRVDFAILSMEQIVNQAAKWHYMFAGATRVPLVIRIIIGRGWGQGPQHSQSLQSWFAHVPGLKVVMPATPRDAKGMLIASIEDDSPVVFLEHRWLYGTFGQVPEGIYAVPLGLARIARAGAHVTIVALSYMVVEALRAAEILARAGIEAEVIDVRSLRPLDGATIVESVRRTGHLLVCDTDWVFAGMSSEIVAHVAEHCLGALRAPPRRLGLSDTPIPTTPALSRFCYPRAVDVAHAAAEVLGSDPSQLDRFVPADLMPLDVPDATFAGPF
jgi:2-oxoisovalerate dehydrogenase E1 component